MSDAPLPFGAVLVASCADWRVATWRNVMMIVASGEIDRAFLDATLVAHDALAQSGGYGVISVTDRGSKIPSNEVRKRASELRRQTQHMLRAQATVIWGDGFFASTMRGVLTGIFALAESRAPLRVVSSDVEAADFVVRRACTSDADPSQAVEVLARLRAMR
jgi:hypothetical protein